MKQSGFSKFLVTGPSLALKTTWIDEISEEFPEANIIPLVGGSLTERYDTIKKIPKNEKTIVLTNAEALWKLREIFRTWNPQGVVADELHLFKTPGSRRTRALNFIGTKSEWRRGLTGTLTPNGYKDVYAQYKFLDESLFGTSFQRFSDEYLIVDKRWPSRVIGYRNLDAMQEKILSISSIVEREKLLGMPHIQTVNQSVPLDDKTKRVYDRIVKEHIVECSGRETTLDHHFSRLAMLQQLTSGFLRTPEGIVWVHQEKLNALEEELDATSEKAVIFFQYKPEGEAIQTLLQRMKLSYVFVDGSIDSDEKVSRCRKFQNDKDVQIIVMQEKVGSLGISLAVSNICIFFSHSFNYDYVKQASDRIWKPSGSLLYVFLRCPDTVDYFAKKLIEMKSDASNALLHSSFEKVAYGDL